MNSPFLRNIGVASRGISREQAADLIARKLRPVVFAWAVVNDETGRLMLCDIGLPGVQGLCRMQAPAIYMTRAAAKHHCADNERVVKISIREV